MLRRGSGFTKRNSREYKHVRCGPQRRSRSRIQLHGKPLAYMKRTYCCECEDMFDINEYSWSDTNERLTDYYNRYLKKDNVLQRLLQRHPISGSFGWRFGVRTSGTFCWTYAERRCCHPWISAVYHYRSRCFVQNYMFVMTISFSKPPSVPMTLYAELIESIDSRNDRQLDIP